MMVFKSNKKNIYLLFIVIVILQLSIVYYQKSKVQDLFIDEYYTLNFIGAHYFPLLWDCKEYSNMWLDQRFWHNLLTVQKSQIFDFASVYYNTAQDVHPPIYYFVEHFLISFFPDKINVLVAVFPNFVEFLLCQCFLFVISKCLLGNELLAIFVCAIYGFSFGGINTVALIRMYMLLTLWCVCYYYLSLRYLENYNCKWYIVLGLVDILGFLTHYYFIIFASAVYFALCFYFWKNNNYRDIFILTIVNVLALICCFIIFPEAYVQIFGNSYNSIRGVQIINNFFYGIGFNYYILLFLFIDLPILLIIVFLTLDYIVKCVFDKSSMDFSFKFKYELTEYYKYTFCALAMAGLIVAKISPYKDPRYFYFLYPFIILASVYYFILIWNRCNYKNSYLVFVVVFIINVSPYYFLQNDILRYKGYMKLNSLLNAMKITNISKCIVLLKKYDPVVLVHNMGLHYKMPLTYITNIEDLCKSNLDIGESVLVVLDANITEKEEQEVYTYMFKQYGLLPKESYERDTFILRKNILFSK